MFCDHWYIEYLDSYEIYVDPDYFLWEDAINAFYKWQEYNGEYAFWSTNERPIADSCLPGYEAPVEEPTTTATSTTDATTTEETTTTEEPSTTEENTTTADETGQTEQSSYSGPSDSVATYHAAKSATSESLYHGTSKFDTVPWGIGEGMDFGTTQPDAVLFTQYAITQDQDWGSMNVDGHTMFAWATRWSIPIWGGRVHTNNHERAITTEGSDGQENVFYSLDEYRSAFQQFLATAPQNHLIYHISTHGAPWQYLLGGSYIQGE